MVPRGRFQAGLFSDEWWVYRLEGQNQHAILITPLRPAGAHRRFRIPRERLAKDPKFASLHPHAAGQSVLEKAPRERVVERIEALARRKNDVFAWRELICGYRRRGIRRPVQRALREIGVERALRLVRTVAGDWGDEAVAFLREELRKKNKPLPPPAPANWDWTQRPYWDD